MSVKCQVIIEAIERLAPKYLAENWDNVGLLVGSPVQNVAKIRVTLDVTQAVVDQAIQDGIDLIITHHPVIFKPMTHIRTDLPQGKLLSSLLKADIAVYAAHTNLDSSTGGVNDILAAKLNLQSIRTLAVSHTERMNKLVVFVPKTHLEDVRRAILEAGAGHLGNYSHCTFSSDGIGSFLPLEGAQPFVGECGTVHYTHEVRLETIVSDKMSRQVVKAMLKAHPYEEVAYDMIQLVNSGHVSGLGRVGKLTAPIPFVDFILQVKRALGREYVNAAGPRDKMVKKVAVCGGSGAGFIHKAAFAGADVLVTGDIKYHEAQEALAAGIAVIDAGHFATEQPVVPFVAEYLGICGNKHKWEVDISVDTVNKDVFHVY